MRAACRGGVADVDVSDLGQLDTAGAHMLAVLTGGPTAAPASHVRGDHPSAAQLVALVAGAPDHGHAPEPLGPGLVRLFERTGRGLAAAWRDFVATMSFLGEMLIVLARSLTGRARIRWAPMFHVMEEAGVNALPIVATLSFFIGATVAYLGATLLAQFGAAVFSVELVAFAVLREFGVLITAIMLAGRSDSAFTAQIGSMRMQQEIDAMRVLGLDPMEALVVPRVLACVLMTPLLAFGAMMMGLFGGMMVLWATLDITPGFFIARMYSEIPATHFWVGMVKAPVFALVIAVVGCRHGLLVGGDVESLGRHVTAAVVQSIFAVIVIDAVFAMVFLELGI